MTDFIAKLMLSPFIAAFFLGDIATFIYFTVDRWDSLSVWQRIVSVPFDMFFATVWPISLPMYLLGWMD